MKALDVTISLDKLKCIDEADGIGSAEPYLWMVFFKLDADVVTTGQAQVFTRPGNAGDLPNDDVDAGEVVVIPPGLGTLKTTLKPLPIPGKEGESRIGFVAVLMEEDDTADHAIAKGHQKLNAEVKAALQKFVQAAIAGHFPTQHDIDVAVASAGEKVKQAIKNDLNFFEMLANQDDKIGTMFVMKTLSELTKAGAAGISLKKHFKGDNGEWELIGHAVGKVRN